MRAVLPLMLLLLSCGLFQARAQAGQNAGDSGTTNRTPVVFDKLLANDGSVLMTNAEFRRVFAGKLIFRNENAMNSFEPSKLDPSVLQKLGIDLDAMKAAQARADQARKARVAQAAQREKQQEEYLQSQGGWIVPGSSFSEPPRPERPKRKPLDLTDSRACLLELADLCTHPFVVDRFISANIHGACFVNEALDDDLTVRELDATVRFDHLETSPDPTFRKLVSQARPLVEDTWRFCRDAQSFGWHRRYREQAYLEIHNGEKNMSAGMGVVMDSSLPSPSDMYPALYGRPGDAEERERRNEMQDADGQKFMNSYADSLRDWRNSMDLDRLWQARMNLYCLARGTVLDKLTALWDHELIPRLNAANRPAQKLIGPNYNEQLVDPGLRAPLFDTQVSFRNISGQTLSNVVIVLEEQGYFGDVSQWRGFLPVFPAGAKIYALPQDAAARLMENARTEWKAKLSVYADNGKQENMDVLPYNRGAELLSYQLTHRSGNPLSQGVSPELKQRRDAFVATNSDLLPQVPGFMAHLWTNYTAPFNPDAERAKLIPAMVPNTDYKVVPPEYKTWSYEVLHLGRLDDPSGVVDVKVSATSADDGKVSVFNLKARFNEDTDSGYVLGVASQEDSQAYGGQFAQPYIRLVTSPVDLVSCSQDRAIEGGEGSVDQPSTTSTVLSLFGPAQPANSQLDQYKLLLQQKRAHELLCQYAIYLRGDGKLGLQSFSEQYQQCWYNQLEPMGKN